MSNVQHVDNDDDDKNLIILNLQTRKKAGRRLSEVLCCVVYGQILGLDLDYAFPRFLYEFDISLLHSATHVCMYVLSWRRREKIHVHNTHTHFYVGLYDYIM